MTGNGWRYFTLSVLLLLPILARLSISLSRPRVPPRELAAFSRGMGESMDAGYHLVACLDRAESRTEDPYLRKVIGQVIHGVERGYPLSTSMARCPDVFDTSYVRAVWHGEVTATCDKVLLSLGGIGSGSAAVRPPSRFRTDGRARP